MKLIISIFILISVSLFGGQLNISSLFDNDMVIQHSKPFRIWGTSQPNTKISIRFMDEIFSTESDSVGDWTLKLSSYDIGGPHEMIVESHSEVIKLNNVMIGDVWLCSGQSNMNMPLAGWGRVFNYEKEIAEANYPDIRLLTIPLTLSSSPQDYADTEGWDVCSPETIENFSAVAYFFARKVYKETGIPIGLIHSSKGGTPIESWMCESALEGRIDLKEKIEDVKNSNEEKYRKLNNNYKQEFKNWYESLNDIDPGNTSNPKWYSNSKDVSNWKSMNLPAAWENTIGKYDGVVWFAKDVVVPDDMFGQDLELNIGPVQDYDITFFNGKKIGQQNSKNSLSIYSIPKELVKSGNNRIVVRVLDLYGAGGLWGTHDKLELNSKDGKSISLKGEWKFKPAIDLSQLKNSPPKRVNPDRNPTILFNGMISPLLNLNFAGVLWYQGESNGRNAYQYREMFPRMINHWREHFSNPQLHFYFVQLANYMEPKNQPVDVEWPVLRESQALALELKNTGMATTIDIGDQYDVHPKNKEEVGRRLALIALNKYYNKGQSFSGPIYDSMEVIGDTVKIAFQNVYNGLTISDADSLREFTIAGADKVFYIASAKIVDNNVLVYCPMVKRPAAVRYAWQNNPNVNLYNSEELPAYPFRTDNWKVKTQ